jgi:type II secretory pathway pseudopilin PulG
MTKIIKNKLGFTLIELAITFTVVSMIIGTVLVSLSKSDRTEKYVNTQKKLDKIAAALRVYANTYNALPCPAPAELQISNANFGKSDCPGSGTAAATNIYGGMVPFATLSLPPDYAFDEWGRRISYIMDNDAITGSLNIKIKSTTEDIVALDGSNNGGAAYVLISHGQNGYLTFNARVGNTATRVLPTGTTAITTNEKENCPTFGITDCTWNATFIQSVPIQNPQTNYFDDIVVYKLADELK